MTAAFQLNAFQPDAFQTQTVSGVLYAVDQNDTGAFFGTVGATDKTDTHDGFTHKELKQIEANKKRLEKLRLKQEKAFADANNRRKKAIEDVVTPPIATVKIDEVQSLNPAEVIVTDELKSINDDIARLMLQQELLTKQLIQKQAIAQYTAYMQYLEAQHLANLDDEETLLMLL